MRAVLCRKFGDYHDVKVEEVETPALPSDGLLIDVEASGLSFATHLVLAGTYQRRPPLPFSPGPEVAGVVREVAPGIDRFAPGDKVLAGVDWGGQAGICAARAVNTHLIPDGMGFDEATTFSLTYPTSYGALVWRAGLAAGETLVVLGAAGAIGLAAVQIGLALGARVIAVAGGAEKCRFLSRQGADAVIDHQLDDVREGVLDLTGGGGAQVVFDPIGGEVSHQALRYIAPEGRLLSLGYASGDIPKLPANIFLLKNISLIGFNYGHYIGWSPGDGRARYFPAVAKMQAELAAMYGNGRLKPVISARYPLDGFVEALDRLLARSVIGKCVIGISAADRA